MGSKYQVLKQITVNNQMYDYFSLPDLEKLGFRISSMPISIRIVLESLIRNLDGVRIKEKDLENLLKYEASNPGNFEIPFMASRVLMQDFTGVPAIVDLASMRDKTKSLGKDPKMINPSVPVDLVIDHSVQVDFFGNTEAYAKNMEKEFERNIERYKFLKWARNSFNNVRIVPPGVGICHQVNLEFLGKVVSDKTTQNGKVAFFDSLVGTDSHTTMINGLGIFGFGVGGIEAEAGMLGEPVTFQIPPVVGVNLHGKLVEGVTATDLVLTLAQILRRANVVGKFVEFFGEGVGSLTVQDRATMSNMCPEYGATVALFPVDEQTISYMNNTGRSKEQLELVTTYLKAQEMFGAQKGMEFSELIDLDLGSVRPSVSGPKLPQQRVGLGDLKSNFLDFLETKENIQVARGASKQVVLRKAPVIIGDFKTDLSDGDVAIAAITSCTNTSNQSVMIAAGLLAKKAVERGLKVNPRVKTSLAPGSRVVSEYLESSGLQKYLDQLGFYLVGYGCTTCIGNSGPLEPSIENAINENDLSVAAVLSGNRNFEARIHRDVRANYLMSPPLVVALALAGTVVIDLEHEPLGKGRDGEDVYLKDIWPSSQEIMVVAERHITRDDYIEKYKDLDSYNQRWIQLDAPGSETYAWDDKSTYIRNPPYFDRFDPGESRILETIQGAYPLLILGDSVTTDHISPAGSISKSSPAGKYLIDHGVRPQDFNSYGSRRGNHEVMIRGTYSNPRIRNLLVGMEGGKTVHLPDNKEMWVYDAAQTYLSERRPLVVFAGREYGTGSSRDWAAKGSWALGIKAVVAESFERIHRSNLVGMGVIPLQFQNGKRFGSLDLEITKPVDLEFASDSKTATLRYVDSSGEERLEPLILRIDNEAEMLYFRRGGILQNALHNIVTHER